MVTRRVSKNLQQVRTGGEGTGYRSDNTSQTKSRGTAQPRSRAFLRKSFLGQATGWGRNHCLAPVPACSPPCNVQCSSSACMKQQLCIGPPRSWLLSPSFTHSVCFSLLLLSHRTAPANKTNTSVFGKHYECIAQKCTYLQCLPPLASHLLLLSHCVLTLHGDQKQKVKR